MDDIYIQVLKFARDNPGFSLKTLEEKFPNDFSWLKREYEHGHLFQTSKMGDTSESYLSFEDRFRLLEHEELNEARKSSKHAMYIAIISILLTFSSLAYQFVTVTSVKVINAKDLMCQPCTDKTHNKTLNSDTAKDAAPVS